MTLVVEITVTAMDVVVLLLLGAITVDVVVPLVVIVEDVTALLTLVLVAADVTVVDSDDDDTVDDTADDTADDIVDDTVDDIVDDIATDDDDDDVGIIGGRIIPVHMYALWSNNIAINTTKQCTYKTICYYSGMYPVLG